MAELPTVKIVSDKNEKGWRIINRSDFNPDLHKLFGAEPEGDEAPKRGRKKAAE